MAVAPYGNSRGSAACSSTVMRDTDDHPFPGQPLVYYAEGPKPDSSKYKAQEKNKKPSAFVKAFQWYTQEHGTEKSPANDKQEIGFAAWLDQKYEQYIWDINSNDVTLKSEDRSTAQPSAAGQHAPTHKSDKTKGFQRILKSPWKKRRAAAKSREERHNCSECRPSWQILLGPKSMSRLPSEICAQKVSLKLCTSSKVTVASSDTQVTARTYFETLGIVFIKSANDVGNEDSDFDYRDKGKPVKQRVDSQHTYMFREKNSSIFTTSKKKIKCECQVISKDKRRTEQTYLSPKYAPNTFRFRSEEKSLNNATRIHRKNNRFNAKNSKTNVTCDCPVLPKVMHVNMMDSSTQYDPNNIFSAKNSKTGVTCDCPVLPKVHVNMMDSSTQYDPHILEDKNSSNVKDAKIKGDHSVVPKDMAEIDIEKEPREYVKSVCCCHKCRIQGTTQTTDQIITLPTSFQHRNSKAISSRGRSPCVDAAIIREPPTRSTDDLVRIAGRGALHDRVSTYLTPELN